MSGRPRLDLAGLRFGRLTVLALAGIVRRGTHWVCRCDCGQRVNVGATALRCGYTKSCGCLRRETARATGKATTAKAAASHARTRRLMAAHGSVEIARDAKDWSGAETASRDLAAVWR